MIRVAWRRQRLQLLITALLIAAVGAVLLFYRFDAVSLIQDRGIAGCLRIGVDPCSRSAMAALSSEYKTYVSIIPMVLLCLPVLLGVFAGASLFAGEFEHGTHVFGLTQSVSRRRWPATKLLVGGGPVTVLMLVLGLVGAWALTPLNHVTRGPMMTPGFETQGLVPAAYTPSRRTVIRCPRTVQSSRVRRHLPYRDRRAASARATSAVNTLSQVPLTDHPPPSWYVRNGLST
ncbi:hypothetical protein ACFWCB_09645 [Streptomyces sp. NPDC060048]|uniref:hypothetical protein n=1 Tax=unclassified Streptomyces TaxID=2593676 RepID=UPI003673EA5A